MVKRFLQENCGNLGFMNGIWVLIALVSMAGTSNAQNFHKAQINEVDVYFNGGVLYHNVENIVLSKGLETLTLGPISSSVLPQTLRISIPKQSFLVDFEIITDSQSYDDSLRAQIFHTEILEAKDSLQSVKMKKAFVERLLNVLYSNTKIEVSEKSIYVDDLDELLYYLGNKQRSLHKRLEKIKDHEKQLVDQLDSLKTSKRNWIATSNMPHSYLKVKIRSEVDINTDLNFNYGISNMNWQPRYFLSEGEEASKVKLKVAAQLSQSSGLNWSVLPANFISDSIDFKLSRVGNVDNDFIDPSEQLKRLGADYFAKEYSVSQIPSLDNQSKYLVFGLSSSEHKVSRPIFFMPTEHPKPVEFLQLNEMAGTHLEKGLLNIQLEGFFLSQVPFQKPTFTDSISIRLGNAIGIRASKEIEKEKLSKSIISNKKKAVVKFLVTLKNETQSNKVLFVIDRVPSGKNNQVELKLDLPRNTEVRGNYFFSKQELKPGEEIEVNYGFELTYPKDLELNDYYNF